MVQHPMGRIRLRPTTYRHSQTSPCKAGVQRKVSVSRTDKCIHIYHSDTYALLKGGKINTSQKKNKNMFLFYFPKNLENDAKRALVLWRHKRSKRENDESFVEMFFQKFHRMQLQLSALRKYKFIHCVIAIAVCRERFSFAFEPRKKPEIKLKWNEFIQK